MNSHYCTDDRPVVLPGFISYRNWPGKHTQEFYEVAFAENIEPSRFKWAFLLQEGCEIVLLYVIGLLNGSTKKEKFSSGSAAVLTGRLSRRSWSAAFTLRKAMNGEASTLPRVSSTLARRRRRCCCMHASTASPLSLSLSDCLTPVFPHQLENPGFSASAPTSEADSNANPGLKCLFDSPSPLPADLIASKQGSSYLIQWCSRALFIYFFLFWGVLRPPFVS